jgi:phospholipid/cholesterol/gamma-HCH transport system substrate-binding protein
MSRTTTSQFSRARVVLVAVTTAVGLAVAGAVTAKVLDEPESDVYVYFADASPLIKGNDVKASGVKVGTIGSIEVEDGKAKVGLVLDDAVLPLHQDATALVRPVGLLGERYIELDRGSPAAATVEDGGVIPINRTSRATDLDEVLNMVDEPTGQAISTLVTTLGEGLLGQGENADAAIKALAPALEDTDRLGQILADQNAVLADLLDSVTPVGRQLGIERGARLDRLVGAADDALTVTARADHALRNTLDQLPRALLETRSTLSALRGAADSTEPVLEALRPTTEDLLQLSRELRAFSRVAGPALDSVDPVLDQASELLERARPVARSLSALSGDLRSTARNGRVIATSALDNVTTVLDFIRNWALTTNGQDGLSHYFRAHVVATTELAAGLVPGGEELVPDLPTLPGEGLDDLLADPLSTLGGVTGGLSDGVNGALNGLLGGHKGGRGTRQDGALGGLLPGLGRTDRTSATGLSSTQEQSLMSYLIGGE